MSPVKIVKPLLSLLSACLKETSPLLLQTEGHIPTIPVTANTAAARCHVFLGQLKNRKRGREGEREGKRERRAAEKRGETRNAMSQGHLSAQMKWKW